MPGCRLITRLSAVYFIIGGKEVWFRKKVNFKGKIYATPVVKWFRLIGLEKKTSLSDFLKI